MKPIWKSATFWTAVLGAAAAIPGFVPQLLPLVPPSWEPTLKLVAVLCGLITSVTARQGAAQHAQDKLQSLAGATAENVANEGNPIAAAAIVNSVKTEKA